MRIVREFDCRDGLGRSHPARNLTAITVSAIRRITLPQRSLRELLTSTQVVAIHSHYFRGESIYGHTKDPSTQAAKTTGSNSEHPDHPAYRKDQMGTCPLAVGLLDPSMGMGDWSLEQVIQ